MRILITAGPTREPIDAVRFISNRSSGAMGLALARAAAAAGHRVTLLLGPIQHPPALPPEIVVQPFSSAADLEQRLAVEFPACDLLIMAAAVADFRPVEVHGGKTERGGRLTIELAATPDLVAGCAARRRPGQRVVAFALEEPGSLESRAKAKMARKGVDAIVANPLATMDAATIQGTLYRADGTASTPGAVSKEAFAKWLVAELAG